MKFFVVSDWHIGGKFNEEMFNKGINVLNNTEADYYICAGDITDQGTVAEYTLVTEKYLPMIKKEILMVPGNHDTKNVGDLIWQEMIGPRYFIKKNEEQKVCILGLDSTEPDQNTGRMGRVAINRIYNEFKELDDSWLKVLVFHHQTLPIKFTGRERSALFDAGDTIKAIMDCNVDLVINGHRHISNVYELTDGDISTLIVNAGTLSCKKTRYREEYSVTMIEFNKKQTRAKVEIMRLNEDNPVWENKFNDTICQLKTPENPGTLLKTIMQIGNTDFSDDLFDTENYIAAVKAINSIHADLVIHTGDITAHSYREEFDIAVKMLSLINKPMIVVPGPKDSFPLGFELFENYFGNASPQFSGDNVKIMGFDTCVLDEKIGRLGRGKTRKMLEFHSEDNRVSIVTFHHSIVPLPKSKHESELQDAGDVLAAIVDGDIDLVLTGAKNRAGCWQIDNTVFINSGTVSSRNIVSARGNSFNIIQIYRTEQGLYFKVDEYFVESGDVASLGKIHIRSN